MIQIWVFFVVAKNTEHAYRLSFSKPVREANRELYLTTTPASKIHAPTYTTHTHTHTLSSHTQEQYTAHTAHTAYVVQMPKWLFSISAGAWTTSNYHYARTHTINTYVVVASDCFKWPGKFFDKGHSFQTRRMHSRLLAIHFM